MSAPISDVVKVTVTTDSSPIQQVGFGKGLVLVTHKKWVDRTREYGQAADLAVDGFLTTDPVYIAATAYFAQQPAPKKLKVGRRDANVANINIVAVNSFTYSITLNGVAYTFVSDGTATTAEIRDGLIAAIGSAIAGLVASNGGAAVVTLTGPVAIGALSANLTLAALTASETIAAALDAIKLVDPDFYGVCLGDRASADSQAGASWANANAKILFCASNEANVIAVAPGSDAATLPAILKAAGYDRAITFYHASADVNFIDAAAMGRALALVPGSYTLALKDLQGILVSTLTPTQRANALGKNCNVYEERGSLNQVNYGTMASGKRIDQIHGRDWLSNEVTTQIFAALSKPLKVPFTDAGIAVVDQAARVAGALGVTRNYLASYTTTVPKLSDVSALDKGNRVLKGCKMVAVESGAIESVEYQITVQV